jgi:hypothetical protein
MQKINWRSCGTFSIAWDIESLKRQLQSEIAQAEVVIASNNAKKKGHEPTIAYFQGQMHTCAKLLAMLDQHKLPRGLWLSPISLAIIAAGGIMVWLLH